MTLQEHAKISICKQKKTNLIKTFLHSPYILISKVLREYATPSTMKLANVTRVLKKDSHSEKEDYQPLTTSSYTFFSRPLCTTLYGTKSLYQLVPKICETVKNVTNVSTLSAFRYACLYLLFKT